MRPNGVEFDSTGQDFVDEGLVLVCQNEKGRPDVLGSFLGRRRA